MVKIMKLSERLEMAAFVGIDPLSDGLQRANRLGIAVAADGIQSFLTMPIFDEIDIVFDATSAAAHARHSELLTARGKRVIDLTPAAIGPFVIPPVNLDEHLSAPNINMVTCGGQATIPIVAAVNSVASVRYAEIVASIASKSAGPGTRANIDEFTETTSRAIEQVGGAAIGKAIIILNPAEPPLIMRDTIYCLCDQAEERDLRLAIDNMVAKVKSYVPGYRLKQAIQIERIGDNRPLFIPDGDFEFTGLKVSIFVEVEGAAHHLPSYAGNLDIMTSAALQAAERIVALREREWA